MKNVELPFVKEMFDAIAPKYRFVKSTIKLEAGCLLETSAGI
jgi:hypothetical protein